MFCCRTWPATCWLHWFACRSGAKVESESVPFIKWLARVWSEEVEMEALKQVRVVIKQLKATEEVWRKFGGHQWVCIHSFQRTVFIGKCWFQRSRRLSINHFMYASRVWIHFSVKIWTWSVSECWGQVFPTAKKKNSSLFRFGFVEGCCSNGWQDWVFVKA